MFLHVTTFLSIFIYICLTIETKGFKIGNNDIVLDYDINDPNDVDAVITNYPDVNYNLGNLLNRAPAKIPDNPLGSKRMVIKPIPIVPQETNLEYNEKRPYYNPLIKINKVKQQSPNDFIDDTSDTVKSYRPSIETDELEGTTYLRDIQRMIERLNAKKQSLVEQKLAAIVEELGKLYDDVVDELMDTELLRVGEQKKKSFLPPNTFYNYWTYKKQIPLDDCPGEQVLLGNMCIWTPEHRRRRKAEQNSIVYY